MAKWLLEPSEYKSLQEVQHWKRGKDTLTLTNGWRHGSFYVYTDDDNEPVIEDGDDLYDCGYRVELKETSDTYFNDYECSCDLEEDEEEDIFMCPEVYGWVETNTEMWLYADPEITFLQYGVRP